MATLTAKNIQLINNTTTITGKINLANDQK